MTSLVISLHPHHKGKPHTGNTETQQEPPALAQNPQSAGGALITHFITTRREPWCGKMNLRAVGKSHRQHPSSGLEGRAGETSQKDTTFIYIWSARAEVREPCVNRSIENRLRGRRQVENDSRLSNS